MKQKLGGERGAVQNPLIRYACSPSLDHINSMGQRLSFNLGWEYIDPKEALRLRGGNSGIVFRELFIKQMLKINPDFMDNLHAEELIKRIERIPANIEGNLIFWEYLKGLKSVFVPNENRERNVSLLDTENIERNTFHVTDEFIFNNGTKTNRPDVVFLINGIPVFIVEAKAAHKIDGISDALEQIRRYHRESPELLSILQVYTLTHGVRYYYSATWNTAGKWLLNWKEEVDGNFEMLVKSFFDKRRVIKVLTDYILFTRQDDELKKVVLRPHQMRAVEKLAVRASDPKKKRALIWHTQGSGKTFTMIVTAQKIIENSLFENPTVIMLVDRNELESQLFRNLSEIGIENVEVADSKKGLRKLLAEDRRGLIVTMIHKFHEIPQSINTRENIFVLVDEAHRTTSGDLGNYLVGALPKATLIGFTGTPIDKTSYGKGTFITFGKDDPPHGYLDKYGIAESIEDKATVHLHYALAPNELKVNQEVLEREFLSLKSAEGMSDIEELNEILKKAVTLKNELKNKKRVQDVAKYIADHYKENVEPLGYKAFVVAVDREACAFYKKELDKHFPPEYSEVIYSPGHNDSQELAEFHLSDDREKQIRKDFRSPDKEPKILIVTAKLLTGFDAPILYCMYLDKPMRDHVLMQAIARVNRPYEDSAGRRKAAGLVIDFIGLFDKLERALAFDSQDITGVVRDLEVLRVRFSELLETAKDKYLAIIKGKTQDKAVEAVLEFFRDEEERHELYHFFKEISDIYDILSPDEFLRPHIDDMETLARMYRIVKETYEPGIATDREFSKKVAKLVQEHTTSGKIKAIIDVFEINEETIKKIEERNASDTEKIFNLIKTIRKCVNENKDESPFLISIGERAEELSKRFKERQDSTEDILDELKDLIKDINAARRAQAKTNETAEIFTMTWLLRKEGFEKPKEVASTMKGVLEGHPYWRSSEKQEREVKQKLVGALIKSGLKNIPKVMKLAQDIMRIIKGNKA